MSMKHINLLNKNMEKKEDIKEYLQKVLDRWNKYDELDGFVAENFRVDLEKTLEYWDLRIADNKQELDKAKIEVLTEIFQTCYQEDSKTRELVEEKLAKLKDKK